MKHNSRRKTLKKEPVIGAPMNFLEEDEEEEKNLEDLEEELKEWKKKYFEFQEANDKEEMDKADQEVARVKEEIKNIRETESETAENEEGPGESDEDDEEEKKPGFFKRAGSKAKEGLKKCAKNAGKGSASFFSGTWNHMRDNRAANMFFIAALVIHLIDASLGFGSLPLRSSLYFLLLIFGWIFVFRNKNYSFFSRPSIGTMTIPLCLSTLALLVPLWIGSWLGPFLHPSLINVIRICFPIYGLYFVFQPMSPFLKSYQKAVLYLWFGILSLMILTALMHGGLREVPFLGEAFGQEVEGSNFWGAWGDLFSFIGGVIGDFFSATVGFFTGSLNTTKGIAESRLEYATAGYYEGDEEDVEKQGVFIEDVETSQPEFRESETVQIFANVEFKTPVDYVPARLSCTIEDEEQEIEGEILGEDEFTVYKDEVWPTVCSFKNLEKGQHDAEIKVEYDYETISSLKVYFMDQERKNTMRSEGVDIFNKYGLERSPDARYTSGPVRVGIKRPPLPIGVESNSDTGPLIGLTIENGWDGKINEIKNIELLLPEGLSLDGCEGFSSKGTEEGFNVYEYTKLGQIGEVEEYITINCPSKIDQKSNLIGEEGISIKYLKVQASYIFETKESVGVKVE